ncbi:hypothetical protein [Solibacillus sp. CAU 1738]|uniref:hypothetical protein n=1 Tax=Solibacillus sp. CAU 1738 TaxID=3140363 RepID=UPI0032613B2C
MKLVKHAETLGLQLLFLVGITVFVSAVSLLFNIKIMGVYFLFGLIVSLALGFYRTYKTEGNNKLIYALLLNIIFISVVSAATFVSGKYYDISWDGQSYHQEAIINLQQGWNPIYDEDLDESFKSNFWINHYAKGTWFFGASVYDLFGDIEYGKVSNLLLLMASFLLSFALLQEIKITKFWSFLIALLAALNPVATNQMLSFYIDGQLASLILILIVLFIKSYIKNSYTIDFAIVLTLILMINIKFTALGYAIIICMLPFVIKLNKYIFDQREYNIKKIIVMLIKKKEFSICILGVFMGVIIVGASSYVSNTLDHGHPFYPLSGEGKVDIMSYNTPISLQDKTTIERFYISIFSESSNNRQEEAQIKFPFKITEEEMKYIWQVDTRVGGLGPLFGAILILALAGALIWNKAIKERTNRVELIILSIIILSIVINPEPWWARYVPQLWLIPILIMIILIKGYQSKGRVIFASILALLIMGNIIAIEKSYIENTVHRNVELKEQLKTLSEYSQNNEVYVTFDTFRSNRVRLESNGVRYTERKKLSCENPFSLGSSTTKICVENVELYNKIKMKYKKEQ